MRSLRTRRRAAEDDEGEDGEQGGVVGFVAFAVFLHACLHSLASEDPETLERLARSGMIMGG